MGDIGIVVVKSQLVNSLVPDRIEQEQLECGLDSNAGLGVLQAAFQQPGNLITRVADESGDGGGLNPFVARVCERLNQV